MKNYLRAFLVVILFAFICPSLLISQSNVDIDGEAVISKMDTITAVQDSSAGNVVRLSDGTLALRQYKVGDFAQGGIIFWVDETGEHGLVADTADIIGSGIGWFNGVFRVTNATGDGVGSGEMNTMLIIAQQTVDDNTGNFAALICANLLRQPYGDWFLPSKEELNLLYLNKEVINATAIANGGSRFRNSAYWSSTEIDSTSVWIHYFDNGSSEASNKDNGFYVRAIRVF